MPCDPKRVQAVFLATSERPASERAAVLDVECANDAELRHRVEALLKASDEPGSFLDKPGLDPAVTVDSQPGMARASGDRGRARVAGETEGSIIGAYKLLQQIGEGGMGTVFMAEQERPVRRKVALKIIRAGMDSAQVVARFEAERQALALMEHPNIARVLDGGTTELGRPYFVMELVKGIPITRFCDEHHMTPRERLELFVPVCHAIQHAHQKGIIHRDLKASNILVAMYDDKPVPKVIDFGVAKATGERLTEQTLFTGFGAIVGTLEYMSPEQARFNALDIDTRSDIYSLGVLLYELLTGTTPFRRDELRQTALDEWLRVIREQEPPKPSTRLSESAATLPAISAQRRTEPAKLPAMVRGELDWIVMKALEKDRSRRYETANGLARDIDRYLHDETVTACPPSVGYKLTKFGRRHKKALGVAALFTLLLVGAAAVSSWQAIRARHAEAAALAERDAAVDARAQEEEQRRQALAAREAESQQRERAEAERDAKDRALARAEGLGLVAQSSDALPTNPGLALLLAIEGAKRHPSRLTNNALVASLAACREERTLLGHEAPVQSAAFSPDGRRVLSFARYSYGDSTVRFWDAATGKSTGQLIPWARHTKEVLLSPDGRRVATRYEGFTLVYDKDRKQKRYSDEVVYIWDAETGKPLHLLRGHENLVTSIAFSPDGKRLLTASWDRTARIWDVDTGKQLLVVKNEVASLARARFSPDGLRILTVSTGRPHSRYGFGQKRLPSADEPEPSAMRPLDRKESGGYGGGSSYGGPGHDPHLAKIWDAVDGREVASLSRGNAMLMVLFGESNTLDGDFSPDGRLVLLRGDMANALLWDPSANKILFTINEAGHISSASFSSDSKRILTAFDKTARLRDAATGEILATMDKHTRRITSASFSPDGRLCATASEDMTGRVWDGTTGAEIAVLNGHEQRLQSIAFSPDGQRIVTASDDRTIRLWKVAQPSAISQALRGHGAGVRALAFSPDGSRLATASDDKTARLWDVATGKESAVLQGHAEIASAEARRRVLGAVLAVRFSPDGRRLFAGGDESFTRIQSSFLGLKSEVKQVPFLPARAWQVESAKETVGFPGEESGIGFIQLSRDGKRLLAAENGRVHKNTPQEMSTNWDRVQSVYVWEAETGKRIATFKPGAMRLASAPLSPDGSRVVTSAMGNDGRCALRLWDVASGKELRQMKSEDPAIFWHAQFSQDGQRILGFWPGRARSWNVDTGEVVSRYEEPGLAESPNECSVCVASQDERRVAAVSGERVCLWDVETLRPVFHLEGHQRQINSAAFSLDGRRLVTASDDETARIWDVATGEEQFRLIGHQGPVQAVEFSPDGKLVATASLDGTARLWQTDPLPIAEARKPRELTPAERRRFEIR